MPSVYRLFNLQLESKTLLSPSLIRCVFTGPDVRMMKQEAPDQRVKLLFASETGELTPMAVSDTWYQDYLALPREHRPTLRTYTLRAVSRELQQATIDFVLHGDTGPASRWASHAKPGDTLQIVAPNIDAEGDNGGYEWAPHDGVEHVLLIADETALPAAMGILENLMAQPSPPSVQAFFEVPKVGDCISESPFPFAQIHWLPREETGSQVWGERLLAAVKQDVNIPASACVKDGEEIKDTPDGELLWERATGHSPFYAWVAGESSAVKRLRRYLLDERQLAKETINFMAYWSHR
ncbi:siderophore-interacting protein [Pectobacterium sp. B1J-3]|uniref:siderophore-interacting protein n=1 Tax=Pectobacterium sp. B1J-3 TaxID=3385371 RepID=UPI0039057860